MKEETYTQAFERLQKIVSQIESGELEIDQLADIAVHTLQMLVSYLWAGNLHVEDNMQIYFTKRL